MIYTDAKPLCRILMPNLYAGVYMLPLWAVSKASSIKIKKIGAEYRLGSRGSIPIDSGNGLSLDTSY